MFEARPDHKTMPTEPIAAIDLGSNTLRLLVGVLRQGRMDRLLQRQVVTRLGEGLSSGCPLSRQAAERTRLALEKLAGEIRGLGVRRTLLGATMAVRQASDGADFLQDISEQFGFETRILSGSDEARLTAAGVLGVLEPPPQSGAIFDLGGRSTEFIALHEGRPGQAVSLELGGVAMTEAFLHSDPPLPAEIKELREFAARRFREALNNWNHLKKEEVLVGTAGTTTTLAAMAQGLTHYRRELIDNFLLSREALEGMLETMCALTTRQRARRMPGLPEDRADIIAAGTILVVEIINFFNKNRLTVSDAGLLEGLWLTAAGFRSG